MHKHVTLILVAILTLSSLTMIRPATSQITKPSVPEFTLQIVTKPYDIPTTYSTNPYTGKTITSPGYHVENMSIIIQIKNQPFTAQLSNGSIYSFVL